jgi:hypothetical protein
LAFCHSKKRHKTKALLLFFPKVGKFLIFVIFRNNTLHYWLICWASSTKIFMENRLNGDLLDALLRPYIEKIVEEQVSQQFKKNYNTN